MSRRKNKPVDVFKNIDMTGGDDACWPWKLELQKERPYFRLNGKKELAYRLVYTLMYGAIPDGQVVRHKCDNSACCNPYHLELGSHQENMDDMKERQRHGLPHHTVKSIKRLIEDGVADKVIAERFGQKEANIAKIRLGKTYKHVDPNEGDENGSD